MSGRLFTSRYDQMRRLIDRKLETLVKKSEPTDLNRGLKYVLTSGGKRVRSSLVILSCEAVGGTRHDAMDAGAAVEMLHNFTLVHDDIMDNAPSRRGRPTVHTKWDVNNALLVGDVLLGMAYASLTKSRTRELHTLVHLFTGGFLEVCEGQALDLEYERRRKVSLREYFVMIEKKTARLISMSCEVGGLLGNATPRQRKALRQFGHYIGRAFQVQDDLLDVAAEPRRFGKALGGDILEGKKTFLLTKAAERVRGKDRTLLERVMQLKSEPTATLRTSTQRQAFVAAVTDLYRRHGIMSAARQQIAHDTRKATAALAELPQNQATAMLGWFSQMLLQRLS